MLVTDRQLTSTAILYRLYIRYQPGGPGEKSLILKELTQLPKTHTMSELATALRSWRRHFGRAREVGASLPDGTLLLRTLETGVQLVAKENSQAAFRLAQSRSALQVDEQPQPSTIWDFSQCLLAEAETLVLLNSSATSLSESPPLKLKIMESQRHRCSYEASVRRELLGQGTWWQHSRCALSLVQERRWLPCWQTVQVVPQLDGISDKNARCWNCGSKEHTGNRQSRSFF